MILWGCAYPYTRAYTPYADYSTIMHIPHCTISRSSHFRVVFVGLKLPHQMVSGATSSAVPLFLLPLYADYSTILVHILGSHIRMVFCNCSGCQVYHMSVELMSSTEPRARFFPFPRWFASVPFPRAKSFGWMGSPSGCFWHAHD
jgi:hypothetical protein